MALSLRLKIITQGIKYILFDTLDPSRQLPDYEMQYDKIKSVTGFVFSIVKEDSNADKVMNAEDRKDILLTDYRGKEPKIILEQINQVLGISQNSVESVMIFYVDKDKNNKAIEFNHKSGKITKSSDINFSTAPKHD